MKRFLAILLACGMLAVSLTACTTSETLSDKSDTQDNTANVSSDGDSKDTLVIGLSLEPTSFDAINANTDQKDVTILYNVYDTLVRIDPEGNLVPHLAKSWEVSDDGLEYTIYLEENVYFQNGTHMTAEDVKFTIDNVKDTGNGTSLLLNLKTCDIIDDYTVKCTLSSPFASFMTGLASRVGAIYCKSYYEENGPDILQESPMGTGPYCFVERIPGDQIILERNENWWKGEVPIKKVILKTIIDPNTQIIALESGEVDLLLNPAVSYLTHLDESRGVTWSYGTSSGQEMLYFTEISTWGGNDNFRKAVQYAVNKKEVLTAVMEDYSYVLDISMPYTYAGAPDLEDCYIVEQDVEKAKEYLAASGYNGEEFKVLVNSGTAAEEIAKVIQGQLQQELGINMTIMAVDAATFDSINYNRDQFDAVIRFYQSSLNDADTVAQVYATGTWGVELFGTWPFADEMADLYMRGRAAVGEERKEIYAQVVSVINEYAVRVPFYVDINTVAHNSNLKGIVSHPLNMYYYDLLSW